MCRSRMRPWQCYQFVRQGKMHDNVSDLLVKEIAPPVDTEYDTQHEMGLNMGSVRSVNLIGGRGLAAGRQGLCPSK